MSEPAAAGWSGNDELLAGTHGRVALCLNSSFLGFFAHAGFLRALTEFGVRPVAVSGASAGALVAGAYAAGIPPTQIIEWFLRGDLRAAFWEWSSFGRIFGTIMNRRGHTGFLRGHRALAILRDQLGRKRIEDCAPALAISATDLTRRRAALLTSGPLAEGILASGAFPGLFAAQSVDGAQFWDGGLVNPLPFDHWLDDPAIDTILVHAVSNPESSGHGEPTIVRAGGIAHEIMCDEILRLKIELARHSGKRLLFLRTSAPRPHPWNSRTVGPTCIEAGAATVARHRAELSACTAAPTVPQL